MFRFGVISFVVAMHATCLAQEECFSNFDCPASNKCCNGVCKNATNCFTFHCVNNSDCSPEEQCYSNQCIPYCDLCTNDEYCKDGKYCVVVKTDSTSDNSGISLSVLIVIILLIVILFACVPCYTCYRYCCQAPSLYHRRQTEDQSIQTVVGTYRQAQSQECTRYYPPIPNVAETNRQVDDQSNSPVWRPCPYESLERLNRTEDLPPPPSYEEAVRNSYNNLNQS